MNYAAIGLFAIVIHLILNHGYLRRQENRDKVNQCFRRYTIAALFYYITDALWGIIYDLKIPALLYADTVLYHVAMTSTVVLLCQYVTYYLQLNARLGKFIRYSGYAFGFFEMVLLIINHFVHIFFWIQPDGSYQAYIMRYATLSMQVLLCVLLAVLTGREIRKASGKKKNRHVTIFLFCAGMTIAIIAQMLYPLLPLYSVGLVVGICIIYTFVKESEKEEQYKVLLSMAGIQHSLHVIDLAEDKITDIHAEREHKEGDHYSANAAQIMEQTVRASADDEYLDRMLAFTDLTTVADRMRGQKSIATQFVSKDTGWVHAMFVAIETNPDGRPNQVIFTTRIIDAEMRREQELIVMSHMDELSGLYNRRAYEDDLLKYPDIPVEPNFVYAAVDINGLKVMNDEKGHAAGDEMIRGAAACLKNTLGNYGKVYRTGGDEFAAMLFADEAHLKAVIRDLEEAQLSWKGTQGQSLSLSFGCVTKREFARETVAEMAGIAEQRMYKSKEEYYSENGVDRRGQAAAHKALCNLYTKILKINLTADTYAIVNMDVSEQNAEKGFADSISGWLHGFGRSGQVHEDDLDEYLKKTDLNYLKEYFSSGKASLSIFYRRKYGDEFKQVAMEMIHADDYSDTNQTLYLYVKNIDI